MSHRDLSNLETELDDLLLTYKIDLALKRQIDNPDLIGHIERVGKVFYAVTRFFAIFGLQAT